VDSSALIEALKDGRLAGAGTVSSLLFMGALSTALAGLDVIEEEPTRIDDSAPAELLAAPNAIITPHTAFYRFVTLFRLPFSSLDSRVQRRKYSRAPAKNCAGCAGGADGPNHAQLCECTPPVNVSL